MVVAICMSVGERKAVLVVLLLCGDVALWRCYNDGLYCSLQSIVGTRLILFTDNTVAEYRYRLVVGQLFAVEYRNRG